MRTVKDRIMAYYAPIKARKVHPNPEFAKILKAAGKIADKAKPEQKDLDEMRRLAFQHERLS